MLTAAEIWRNYETDGIPASGVHQPDKRSIREWGTGVESTLGAIGLGYATLANINADLEHPANTLAWVYADATPANVGIYQKSGASGSGSWSRVADLPIEVLRLTVTGGTANAIQASASMTPTTPGNKFYLLVANANNTGAVTLALNGGAAVPVKDAFGSALVAGSLLSGSQYLLSYSVDHYQALISQPVDASGVLASTITARDAAAASAAAAAASAASIPDILTKVADSLIQNNVSDTNNDIDVLLDGAAVVTKRLDAAWAVGTNQGGLDTGSKAINSSYHLYLIRRNSDGVQDALFSGSATAPTIPSGWTKVRVLGAVTTNGSGNIRQFIQAGDYFELLVPELEANGFANGTTPNLRTLAGIPHGVKMVAKIYIEGSNSTSQGGYLNAWDADLGVSVTTTGALYAAVVRHSGAPLAGTVVDVLTSAAGQIYTNDNAASGTSTLLMNTKGWFDPRVRRHAI